MAHRVVVLGVLALSLAGGCTAAYAYDSRIDPGATSRAEITIAFTPEFPLRSSKGAADTVDRDQRTVPAEYASAMTWYRVTLSGGYPQPLIATAPWSYSDQLPEPLHWAWIADNGDVITRAGKGLYRLSFANSHNNWFQEVDCRLMAWPEGDSEAAMTCSDGKQRAMQVPGDGIVLVDDIQYVRVFDSEETTLPPPEQIPEARLTPEEQAAVASTGDISIIGADDPDLPSKAPIPQPRTEPVATAPL
jgi:hypothetical protein